MAQGFGRSWARKASAVGRGVEDVGGGEPGAAELRGAPAQVVEIFDGVGVGVDDDAAAELSGQAEMEVVEIGAGGGGVVLDGDAELGGALEDLFHVDGVRIAAEEFAAGGVAEDAGVGVFEGGEDAIGHLLDGLIEAGVDAGDDDVELREGAVVEIELAGAEDIDLDAGEDGDAAFHFIIHVADAGGVGEGAGVVHAVGHGEVLRVVGDGDVAETAGEGGFGHVADGAGSVGLEGVHVEIAADVVAGDEGGQAAFGFASEAGGGGFELAAVLAEFGRDPGEIEGVVDVFFGFGSDDLVVFQAKQGVLGEGEATFDGALAEGDVVVLGAGEVLQGGAVGGAREEADVDLEVVAEGEGDFVLTLSREACR